MPIDQKAVEAYMTELAEAAGIAPDQRPAFLSNEKVVALARRRFEDVEAERGRTAAEARARKEEFDKNMGIYQQNLKAVTDAEAKVKAYEERYGALDPAARAAALEQERKDIIDKKTFEERLAATENNTVGLFTTGLKLLDTFRREFPDKPFDVDAIAKIALEKKIPAETAFNEWVAPMRAERQTTSFEEKLKAAREEGFRDGASKRAAGQIEDSTPKSGFFENMRKEKPDANANPAQAFREAFDNYKPPVRTV
jgi:hypothetical protein